MRNSVLFYRLIYVQKARAVVVLLGEKRVLIYAPLYRIRCVPRPFGAHSLVCEPLIGDGFYRPPATSKMLRVV